MPHSNDRMFEDFREEYKISSFDDLLHFPKFVQIETVSGCNARCNMCSVNSWVRSKAAMSENIFNKLRDELGRHADWVEQVTLQLGGEPLLDRRIEKRIAELKSVGIKSVSLTTNASLLTEARSRALLESEIDAIDFSVDGASASTFDAIRVNLSFETVRFNILRFLSLREEMDKNVCVRVRMVIQDSNAHEFDDFVDYWQQRIRESDSVAGRFLNWWVDWRDELAAIPGVLLDSKNEKPEFNHLPCIAPFSTLVVLSDGRVPLCCLDYNADTEMGSIVDKSIADVWRGNLFSLVRNNQLAGGRQSMEFCKDCHIFATGSGFDLPGLGIKTLDSIASRTID